MHHSCGVCHRQAGLERLDARLELSNLVILLLARTARPRHQRPTRGADGAVEVRVIKTASTGWAGGRTLKQLGDGGDGLWLCEAICSRVCRTWKERCWISVREGSFSLRRCGVRAIRARLDVAVVRGVMNS